MEQIWDYILNTFLNSTFNSITIIVAIFSVLINLFLSIQGWHKNRVIYDIEVENCWLGNDANKEKNKQLREKIKSGKYAVLHVTENVNGHTRVIIGKIRK